MNHVQAESPLAKVENDKQGGGGGGTMKRTKKEVNVFTRHQIAIARRTLEMSDAGALIMGGMTKEEARAILNRNSKG